MSEARDQVLARIRTALERTGPLPAIVRDYRRNGDLDPAARLDLFAQRLVDYRATVRRCPPERLASTVESTLEGQVIVPPGLPAAWRPVSAVTDTGFTPAELDGFDTVLTACAAACAETGTIVLDGSADQGRRAISLVPDRHVCVVRADQVVPTVPELLARLEPTRPMTLVSGPSATSDIELQRVEGVHGPRTLIVILVS